MPPRLPPTPRTIGASPKSPKLVTFTRKELSAILDLYARRVADGEWRDYAIDHLPGSAVFSIFRHSQDRPLFSIAKTATRGIEYAVYEGVKPLRRSADIKLAIKVLEKKLKVVK